MESTTNCIFHPSYTVFSFTAERGKKKKKPHYSSHYGASAAAYFAWPSQQSDLQKASPPPFNHFQTLCASFESLSRCGWNGITPRYVMCKTHTPKTRRSGSCSVASNALRGYTVIMDAGSGCHPGSVTPGVMVTQI